MEIAELRDFVAVVRTGSFVAAAAATGVAKSTLSKRVQMLEASLGILLIERSTRKLRVTPDGALLLERASQLIADADALERSMRDRNDKPRGRLRVSVPMLFGQAMMGPAAAAYTARWPEATIDVVFTDRSVDLIEENFGCAIRIGPLKDSNIIARRLASSRTVLVASPKLVAGRQMPDGLEALANWPTISFTPSGTPVPWRLEVGERQVELLPQSAITLGSLHAVRAAALAGGGVALVPEFIVAEAIAAGALVRLMPDCQGPASSINVIYPSRRHPSARLRAFIDLLVSMLSETPIETFDGIISTSARIRAD
jgi:DNA-binding transcriptional LysR family regulator